MSAKALKESGICCVTSESKALRISGAFVPLPEDGLSEDELSEDGLSENGLPEALLLGEVRSLF